MAKIVYPVDDSANIGFQPRRKDIYIYQGDDLSFAVAFATNASARLDMTGWQGYCSFKRSVNDSSSIDAVVTISDDGLSMNILVPYSITTDMSGTYVYDLQMVTPNGTRKTYMYGNAVVTPEVTK